ncbi:glycosyltransferase, partial [Segatella copri]|uniref:glycosyltransferase n=1 Tax=Segatella copri TaxID=165179 RepID=UPI003F8AC447
IPLRVYTVPFSYNVYSINVHLLAFIVLCYPHAFASDPEELQEMGERGKELVVEKYTIEAVAKQMKQLYSWLLNGGEKPEFVFYK